MQAEFLTFEIKNMKQIYLLLILIGWQLSAQQGTLDPDFNPASGPDGHVYAFASYPDGRFLVAGQFSTFDGEPRANIMRFLADGNPDETFDSGTGIGQFNIITRILLEENGQILIGGMFSQYNGSSPGQGLMRINGDGTLDESFQVNLMGIPEVTAIKKSGDGYLVSGNFTHIDGAQQRYNLIRLHQDGTVDASFMPAPAPGLPSGPNAAVTDLEILPDGRIIMTGNFEWFNGVPCPKIARLFADGTLDTSFSSPANTGNISSIAAEPSGTFIVSGSFLMYDGNPTPPIARIDADGEYQPSFVPPSDFSIIPNSLVVQPDGAILAGGFAFAGSEGGPFFEKLNPDGSRNAVFSANSGSGFDNAITAISLHTDGSILVGGWFAAYDGTSRTYLARLLNEVDLSAPEFGRSLAVFPNPARNLIHLEGVSPDEIVSVFSLTGQLVLRTRPSGQALDVSSLESGMYLGKTEGMPAATFKFVKN